MEYLPIDGLPEFRAETTKLILGKGSKAIKEGRVACCQSLSGTGALRLAAEFIAVNLGKDRRVFVSDPTWVRPPPTLFRRPDSEAPVAPAASPPPVGPLA